MSRKELFEDLIQTALAAHGAGRLQEAESLYRRALDERPDHPDALNLLGVVAIQTDRHEAAIGYLERAVRRNPGCPDSQYNLGLAYAGRGRPADAEAHFRKAVELRADYAEAHNNLANALREQDRLAEAIAHYQLALKVQPAYLAARGNLASSLSSCGRAEEALEHYREALSLAPNSAELRFETGNVLSSLTRFEEAVDEYRKAIALNPRVPDILNNLGLAYFQLNRLDAAVESYRNALRISSDMPDVHNNLGNALDKLNRREDAIVHYRRAVEIDPSHAIAHYNLGNSLRSVNRFSEAAKSFRRSLEIDPQFADAHASLGTTLREHGLLNDALASFRRSLAIKDDPITHSGLVLTMHCHPAFDPVTILAEVRQWNARYVGPLVLPTPEYANDRSPDRRLKIGYLSSDFVRHPVGWFVVPVVCNHDKRRFEVVCYSGVERSDELTEVFARHADQWRDVASLGDDELAETIRGDGVDIIVELSGHTAGNRLLTLARRPAPITVCGGGHYGTTGVDGVDYLLADRFQAPPGSEGFFSEQLIRLPNDYICYGPPSYAPPVAELPALRAGHITFGCFNNLSKVTPDVVRLWSEVLKSVPGSKIRLQTAALKETVTRLRIRESFRSHGIDESRVELEGPVSHVELLNSYRMVDIALDPFPYVGGLTTCEALWMGVPVVTLSGKTFAGRHSTSHLSNVGLERLVASNEKEYVSIARGLASDRDEMHSIRRNLRNMMATSPLCNAERYTRNLEDAFRRIWAKWCESR